MTRVRTARRRCFGRYEGGGGFYEVFHPDVPGRRLGTVIHASDGCWYFDAVGAEVNDPSRGYPTREDACRAMREVTG